LRRLARLAFEMLTDFEIAGRENLPRKGPLIVVGNHFHYADPVAFVGIAPWPIEFLGGFHLIDAPPISKWIPKMWGYYPVHRGGVSLEAMRAAQDVLDQDGILGIFPEGGSWAPVLRRARPGVSFLAAETRAPLLAIGLDGLPGIFPALRRGKRARVTVRIGKVFGPFRAEARGRARRPQLEAIGEEIMRRVAELIPPERRGVFSDDPAVREAAEAVAAYPYGNLQQERG
jgi:1-acyl-sn-glycerol-3-phosphate acyltransferase